MARKRMIDPGFYSDDKIIELDPAVRLLFIGMWNFADDSGVLKYSAKQIKARIFPADGFTDKKVGDWIQSLINVGLLLHNEDQTLIQIKNWTEYQKINRPQPSKYVFVEGSHGTITEESVNIQEPITPNRIEKNITEKKLIETSKNLLDQILEEFDRFYKLYPRKVSKQASIKAWKKLSVKQRETAIDVLPEHIKRWGSNGTEIDFIPHPSTWLNQHSWEDQLTTGALKDTVSDQRVENDYIKQREYYSSLKESTKEDLPQEERKKILFSAIKKGG